MTLFGSRARGDNQPDSDVDIIVEVQPGRSFGLEAVGVYHIIEDHLGLESSIGVLDKYADPAFVNRIRPDFVVVF